MHREQKQRKLQNNFYANNIDPATEEKWSIHTKHFSEEQEIYITKRGGGRIP